MRTLLALLVLAAPSAFAQTHDPNVHGQPAATDASGARPGDDTLTCEQLKAEMSAIAADPPTQNAVGQGQSAISSARDAIAAHPEAAPPLSPEAQRELGRGSGQTSAPTTPGAKPADEAAGEQDDAPAKHGGKLKGLGRALGGGIGGAFGGGRAARAEQQRQIEQMGAAGHAAQEAQQVPTATISPQLMRGMHLEQLAEAKGCGRGGKRGL
jgi:hypothetical protein